MERRPKVLELTYPLSTARTGDLKGTWKPPIIVLSQRLGLGRRMKKRRCERAHSPTQVYINILSLNSSLSMKISSLSERLSESTLWLTLQRLSTDWVAIQGFTACAGRQHSRIVFQTIFLHRLLRYPLTTLNPIRRATRSSVEEWPSTV